MTDSDQQELHRLTAMLETIDGTLDHNSPLREALEKAGLAMSLGFVHGLRPEIELLFQQRSNALSDSQRAKLVSMDIDPEST